MEERLKEEVAVKKNNKKNKYFLIIACTILLLCGIVGALLANGFIKVPTVGGEFVDIKTAKLIKKASNVTDEQTLRELLLLDMDLDIVVTESMEIKESFQVNGNKKLSGAVVFDVDAVGSFKETYAFSVNRNASLTVDGIEVDGNALGIGYFVDQKAKLHFISGKIHHAYKGIVSHGDVVVEDVLMDAIAYGGIHTKYLGKTQVNGGTFVNGFTQALFVDNQGSMTIEDGVVVDNYVSYMIRSYGELIVHGGTYTNCMNAPVMIDSGTAEFDYQGEKKNGYIEIVNSGATAFFISTNDKVSISDVHVDTTPTNAIFFSDGSAKKGDVLISNSVFENTHGNTLSLTGKIKLQNVTVRGSDSSALYVRTTAEVEVENFLAENNDSCGIRVVGGKLTGTKVVIDGAGAHGIQAQQYTEGQKVIVNLTDVETNDVIKNNLNIQKGVEVVITDAELCATNRTNVYLDKECSVELNDVQILGTIDDKTNALSVGAKSVATLNGDSMITDAKKNAIYIVSEGKVTMNAGSVKDSDANGVWIEPKATFNLNGGTISGNKASSGAGVLVYGVMNMKGGTIKNNVSEKSGAGVNLVYNKKKGAYGVLNMTGGTICNNTAGTSGGGIFLSADTIANLSGGTIKGNVSKSLTGHGIYDNGNLTISKNFYMTGNDIALSGPTKAVKVKGTSLAKHNAKDPLLVTPYMTTTTGKIVVQCDSENAVDSLLNTYVASGNRGYILTKNTDQKDTMTVSYGEADMDMTGADKVYVSTFAEFKQAVETTSSKRYVIVCADIEMENYVTVPLGSTVYIRNDGVKRTLSRAEGFTERFFRTGFGTGLYLVGTSSESLVLDGEISGKADAAKTAKLLDVRGTTEIRNVVFEKNEAAGSNSKGGFILQSGGKLYAYSSTFKDATAYTGGAVQVGLGSIYFEDCLFENNKTSYSGGAILGSKGTEVTVVSSRFNGNEAGTNGGAINLVNATGTVRDSILQDNVSGKSGGAVAATETSTVTIENTSQTSNVEFKNNKAALTGGAVYFNDADVTIKGYKFDGNISESEGGAVHVRTNVIVNIEDSEFTNNSTTKAFGGAIASSSKEITLKNAEFGNNSSIKEGGAVSLKSAGEITVTTCDFESNSTNTTGGAFYLKQCEELKITDSTFVENNSKLQGGAMFIMDCSEVAIAETTFTQNSNEEANGGAIYVNNTNMSLNEIDFDGNEAGLAGGAFVATNKVTLTAKNCNFTNNTAVSKEYEGGGAVAITTNSKVDLTDSTFSGNKAETAQRGGGAIYTRYSEVSVANVTFDGNEALSGGAISVAIGAPDSGKSPIKVENSVFTNNKATNGKGGAIFNGSTGSTSEAGVRNVTISSCIFGGTGKGNTSTGYGGAIWTGADGTLTVNGTTFEGNSGSHGGAVATTAGVLDIKAEFRDNVGDGAGAVRADNLVDKTTGAVTKAAIIKITDSTFENNQAKTANGGAVAGTAEFTIVDSDFKVNTAAQNGGAIHNGSTAFTTVAGCTFEENEVKDSGNANRGGGAIFTEGQLTVKNSDNGTTCFVNNLSPHQGGAILTRGALLTVENVEFAGNQAAITGGAISNTSTVADAAMIITNVSFTENASKGSNGGAVYIANGADLTADNNIFAQNTAKVGGAIFVEKTSASILDIEGGEFDGNVATTSGGGAIYFNKDNNANAAEGKLLLTGVTFKNNHSKSQDGAVQVGGAKTEFVADSCHFIGNYTSGDGGAVGITSGTKKAELKGAGTFQGNYTTGTGKAGGAINTNGSSVSITGYTFDGNYAPAGGAINIKSSSAADGSAILLADCIFTSNEAKTTYGGAVQNLGRNVTIVDCIFGAVDKGNQASAHGGAIYSAVGTVTLLATEDGYAKSKFEANIADSSTEDDVQGGAIYMLAGTLNVGYDGSDATTEYGYAFVRNQSKNHGGAIYLPDGVVANIYESLFEENANTANTGGAIASYSKDLNIYNTDFIKNVSTGAGGAIANNSKAILLLDGCTFTENVSNNQYAAGGALSCEGDSEATILNSTFTKNATVSERGGGAIYTNNAKVTITGGAFSENTAVNGGAVYTYNANDKLTISGTTSFTGNSASASGGAIYNTSGTVKATDCVFGGTNVGNRAGKRGGAIYSEAGTITLLSTTETFDDSKFEANTASSSTSTSNVQGGAIFVMSGTLYIGDDNDNSTTEYGYAFINNSSYNHGGALLVSGAKFNNKSDTVVVIRKSGFTGNSNSANNAGAIASYSSRLTISDTAFESNSATGAGGAIAFNSAGNMSITRCEFTGNSAGKTGNPGGGAISSEGGSSVTIENSTFSNNASATTARGGGAIYTANVNVTITNTLFSGNTGKVGGAIYSYNAADVITVNGTSSFSANTPQDIYKYQSGAAVNVAQDINCSVVTR